MLEVLHGGVGAKSGVLPEWSLVKIEKLCASEPRMSRKRSYPLELFVNKIWRLSPINKGAGALLLRISLANRRAHAGS